MMSRRCVAALAVTMVIQWAGAYNHHNQMIDLECYDSEHPTTYMGHTAVTETGAPCQMWGDQSPHAHTDGTDLPSNYCRSIAGDGVNTPWCYTTDARVRWEYCDVPLCSCTGDFVVYGSSCYAYVNESRSWEDSEAHCSSLGGFLAEPMAPDQNDFLHALTLSVGGGGAWLGGLLSESDVWQWASSGEVMTYFNWADGEPGLMGCLKKKQHSNEWKACNCAHPHDSICQKTPNEIPNGGRVNLLANNIDELQASMENMTNYLQDLTQKGNELDDAIQEATHVESGTFQCGTNDWRSHPTQTYEGTFDKAYLAPPTVHVSLATLETNVNQRTLDVNFNVTDTSNTGFTVICENQLGRHFNKLWKLDLSWISVPIAAGLEPQIE